MYTLFRRLVKRLDSRSPWLRGLAVVLAVLLTAALLLKYLFDWGRGKALVEVYPEEVEESVGSGYAWAGTGLTWSQMDSPNLLEQAGFEGFVEKFSAPVIHKAGRSLAFTMRTDPGEIAFASLPEEVELSAENSGSPRVKVRRQENFLLRQSRHLLEEEGLHLPEKVALLSGTVRIREGGGIRDSVLVGEDGLVLYNAHSNQAHLLPAFTSSDLVQVEASGDSYLLRSREGEIWASRDGQHWQAVEASLTGGCEQILATDRAFLLLGHIRGSHGARDVVLMKENRELARWTFRDLPSKLLAFAYDHGFYLLKESGELLRLSERGELEEKSSLAVPPQPRAVSAYGQVLYWATRDGRLFRSEEGGKVLEELTHKRISPLPEGLRLRIFSADELGLLFPGEKALLYEVKEQRLQEIRYQQKSIQNLLLLPQSLLLTIQDGQQLYLHQLATVYSLPEGGEAEVAMEQWQTGDRLRFSAQLPPQLPPPAWKVEGEKGACSAQHEGGQSFLRLASKRKPLRFSQERRLEEENWPERRVFRLRLVAKSRGEQAVRLQARFSGPFAPFSLDFSVDRPEWKVYEQDFVTPAIEENLPLQFTLQLPPGTELDLREIYLGERESQNQGLRLSDYESLHQLRPQHLRFAGLAIGQSGQAPYSWLESREPTFWRQNGRLQQVSGYSLPAALSLSEELGADPWLVIQPFADEREIQDLLSYMAGGAQSEFGARRIAEGQAIPWTIHFRHIYLEFADDAKTLPGDKEKADRVDAGLKAVKTSPYYQELKNKIVFIDGMDYLNNDKLSIADEHASRLEADFLRLQKPGQAYQNLISLFPRRNRGWEEGSGLEMIASFPLYQDSHQLASLAQLSELALLGRGRLAATLNLNLQGVDLQENERLLKALEEILAPQEGGTHRLSLKIFDEPLRQQQEEAEQVEAFASLAPNGSRSYLLTNTGRETVSVLVHLEGLAVRFRERVWDRQGQRLAVEHKKGRRVTVRVPAGGVVELVTEAKSNEP